MSTWHTAFPTREAGGPLRRAEVVMCDIAHGIGKIVALENGAINVVDYLRALKEHAKAKADAPVEQRKIGSLPAVAAKSHTGAKSPAVAALAKSDAAKLREAA
jgi:hypothetical protein